MSRFFFFFNDTATTEIYTLSLHDALPISHVAVQQLVPGLGERQRELVGVLQEAAGDPLVRRVDTQRQVRGEHGRDRKSTRLNSSHLVISYAVFCLEKKKNQVICT